MDPSVTSHSLKGRSAPGEERTDDDASGAGRRCGLRDPQEQRSGDIVEDRGGSQHSGLNACVPKSHVEASPSR